MVERVERGMNYQNAWNCTDCPQDYGPDGCPAWWEYDEVNNEGRFRIITGCGLKLLPEMLRMTAKASHIAAETADKASKQTEIMCRLFVKIVVDHMGIDPERLAHLIPVKETRDALPAPSERPDVGHGDGPPSGGDS